MAEPVDISTWPQKGVVALGATIPTPRPHVMGWGENGPACEEGTTCDTCGKTGFHDVIILGVDETKSILKDMRRDDGER